MRGSAIHFIALLSFLMAFQLCAQSKSNNDRERNGTQQINLETRGLDNEMMHLLDVMPLFELSGAKVSQPIDLSADFPGMTLVEYPVVLPESHYLTDSNSIGTSRTLKSNLVYGFAQHAHGMGELPNHTLIVVERPQVMRYRRSRVWVDVNHNLDLTDDPVQYYTPSSVPFSSPVIAESGSVIRLDNEAWGVTLQLGFLQGGELRSYQKLFADAIDLVKGTRKFIGVQNSFRQRRMSVLWGSTVYKNDTMFWGLKDVNLNGKYSDEGVDMVMVSNDRGIFNTANAWKLKKNRAVLDWLGQGWDINVWKKTEVQGSLHWELMIQPIAADKVKNSRSLLLGNRIPKFKFCVIEGEYKFGKLKENPIHRRSIRNFKGKYTVLLVWNAHDSLFHKDSAIFHRISRQLPDSVQMIMLNHGGSGRYVYGYNRRFETKMIHGFCSPQVAEILKLQTMPQLFLLDRKQRMIDINMSPFELQQWINGTLR